MKNVMGVGLGEIGFRTRYKIYGAYALRKRSRKNTSIAFGISGVGVVFVFLLCWIVQFMRITSAELIADNKAFNNEELPEELKIEPPPIQQTHFWEEGPRVLSILLTGKDRVYWRRNDQDTALHLTTFDENGIRKIILENSEAVKKLGLYDLSKDPNPMIVIIKLSDDAYYKNMVDILDEMEITEQKKYLCFNITRGEAERIKSYEESQGLSISVKKTLANPQIKSFRKMGRQFDKGCYVGGHSDCDAPECTPTVYILVKNSHALD